jgi:hypothetical protein
MSKKVAALILAGALAVLALALAPSGASAAKNCGNASKAKNIKATGLPCAKAKGIANEHVIKGWKQVQGFTCHSKGYKGSCKLRDKLITFTF